MEMSLFGGLGNLEEDPIFGPHMRSMQQMNNVMSSFFGHPFGMIGGNALMDVNHHAPSASDMQIMPFGFSTLDPFNMDQIFSNFGTMTGNHSAINCHSYSSRSVMTMGSGPDGRPQMYQETMSTRTAPGGIKETKKTVCDSVSGTKKMSIGHHIGDRAHILEREKNIHNGDEEECQEFINLDEDEAETFNNEWKNRAKHITGSIDGVKHGNGIYSRNRSANKQLALTEAAPRHAHSYSRWQPAIRRPLKSNSKTCHSSVDPRYSRKY